ncbi:MAG: DUF302 domain-containing protein [Rhodobacteraceae bacterium]|nr:DUF302 domain-containing protein [Paracoccaceae bacterium]
MRILMVLLLVGAAQVHAEEPVLFPYNGSFDDAKLSLESAILNKGLVIDYVSHVGDMLNRTGSDVGSGAQIFNAADIFLFCSAVFSREVMEADPGNIQHCPYGIFVTDKDGEVMIGHKKYPDGPMQKIETLLREIAKEASEF